MVFAARSKFPITPDFMLKLGWAAGRVFARHGRGKVLIGKDTRISGYMFESALESGLSAAGVDVSLLGPMPTPGIAYLTRTFRADAGIVISASHNAYPDNGIKFFSAAGTKLDDALEAEIEAELDRDIVIVGPDSLGKASRIQDAAGRYIEFCKSTLPGRLGLHGMKVVLDCAHGATYHIAPNVFRELGAKVSVIGGEPDGLNINQGVGSTQPQALRAAVIEQGADLGVAFDGDGDRLILVDADGRVIDGDDILYMIARDRHERGVLGGGVVGTLMSNFGLAAALEGLGIPFERAKVGDRYVIERLEANGWQLGGESSGHIVCSHIQSTGDGIVSALQVLAIMAREECSLSELLVGFEKGSPGADQCASGAGLRQQGADGGGCRAGRRGRSGADAGQRRARVAAPQRHGTADSCHGRRASTLRCRCAGGSDRRDGRIQHVGVMR